MSMTFSGSKAATFTAGIVFLLAVVAVAFIVGGDSLLWAVKAAPVQLSRYAQTAFPTLWEYKIHILTFTAVVLVIVFLRKVNDGPVKKH